MIKCSQCKIMQEDTNFRLLRGARSKHRGRQKICNNCERLNNTFKRLQKRYEDDPNSLSEKQMQERDKYLQWYEMIITRDGGPFKARIPNVARKALGHDMKNTATTPYDDAITLEQALHNTELQLKAAGEQVAAVTTGDSQSNGINPNDSTTKGNAETLSVEDRVSKAKAMIVGIDIASLKASTLKNTVYTMLELVNSFSLMDYDAVEDMRVSLEGYAAELEDIDDLLNEECDVAGQLEEAVGVFKDIIIDINSEQHKSLADTLEYLQAVLFEIS